MDPISYPPAAVNYNHLGVRSVPVTQGELWLYTSWALLGAGQQDTQGQARQATGRWGAAGEGPGEAL